MTMAQCIGHKALSPMSHDHRYKALSSMSHGYGYKALSSMSHGHGLKALGIKLYTLYSQHCIPRLYSSFKPIAFNQQRTTYALSTLWCALGCMTLALGRLCSPNWGGYTSSRTHSPVKRTKGTRGTPHCGAECDIESHGLMAKCPGLNISKQCLISHHTPLRCCQVRLMWAKRGHHFDLTGLTSRGDGIGQS